MNFDPILAEIRFGVGLSPEIAPPQSVDDMLDKLTGPDHAAEVFSIPALADTHPNLAEFREATQAVKRSETDESRAQAIEARQALNQRAHFAFERNLAFEIGRSVVTQDGLRERLVRFWADHFTARTKSVLQRHFISSYIEEAIRPFVTRNFGDMLRSVTLHPIMLQYLDQARSAGPNSVIAQARQRGLNENLARELLELHTLGVEGVYSQDDVRQMAELLTGLSVDAENEFVFRRNWAEPGEETVLGHIYGSDPARLEDIFLVLEDLALNPDTAQHLSQKLAVHFIGPESSDELIGALTQTYLSTKGDLLEVTEALLNHPDAWGTDLQKVKPPVGFVASALRALAVDREWFLNAQRFDIKRALYRPLRVMGQTWQEPLGPDGWPEEEDAWITPQGMAGRITWSMTVPDTMVERLPDPREFVHAALGPNAAEAVVFAASAAETKREGVGLVLASAAFQRR